ncbi:unnamed protein product [Chrysodeixis includens]|uniref:Uncharacterized protein n=1 Tax=Chrysodeixis includens TaxID=689277 RepID=A0A9N8L024_CHRIL|nr:unnamed protein product [Chrysodeixis includens]
MITFVAGINEKLLQLKQSIQLQNKLQKLLTLKKNDLLRHYRGEEYRKQDETYQHGSSHSHETHNYGPSRIVDNHPRLTNIQNVNIFDSKQKIALRSGNDDEEISRIMETESDRMCRKLPKEYKCKSRGRKGYAADDNDGFDETENVDEVQKFLMGLDRKLDVGGNYNVDLRCVGNNMCQGRNDLGDTNNDNVARNGKRLSDQDVLLSFNKGDLLCKGNCARHGVNHDRNDNAIDHTGLRCKGGGCGRSRNDDDRREDEVKLNNNVDAIILDTSIEDFISKLNARRSDVYAVN